ncbi:hypothetical protein D032_0784B, partial [Vibrio parahaemolyticus V14/01]
LLKINSRLTHLYSNENSKRLPFSFEL